MKRRIVSIIALTVLLVAPIAGVFIEIYGAPKGEDIVVEGSAAGGTGEGFGEMEGMGGGEKSRGDDDREGRDDDDDEHYEGDFFGGSWFDDFEDEKGFNRSVNVSIGNGQFYFYEIPRQMSNEYAVCKLTGNQLYPDIAIDSNDDSIVTWANQTSGICAKRIHPNGTPIDTNIEVSSGSGTKPTITVDSNDNFTICWDSNGEVIAKRYDTEASPIGNEISIPGGSIDWHSTIVTDSNNDFIVSWANHAGGYDIYARRYDISENTVGDLMQLCNDSNCQENPAMVINSKNELIVTWDDYRNGNDSAIYMRCFTVSGDPIGNEIVVCDKTGDQKYSNIAIDENDNVVVTWQDRRSEVDNDIYAQYFDASCTPKGGDFLVSNDINDQHHPKTVFDNNGNFLISWCSMSGGNVEGRFFSPERVPISDTFIIDDKTGSSSELSIAVDSNNIFTVAWHIHRDGDDDIYAKKYTIGRNKYGTVVSNPISLPPNQQWSTISVAKSEPANTYINVSVLNAETNVTIGKFHNLTNRTIDLSPLNALGITSLHLKAYFSGNGSTTPILDSWGVEWTAENSWRDSLIGESKCVYPLDVDKNVIGYWKFEEGNGNITKDWCGKKNHGDIVGAKWTEGIHGGGLEFDGNNDYVDLSNTGQFHFDGDFSLECWFRPKSDLFQTDYTIVYSGYSGNPTSYCSLYIHHVTRKITFVLKDNLDTAYHNIDSDVSIEKNRWYHAVVLRNNGNVLLYVNGELQVNESTTELDIINSDGDLYIGSNRGVIQFFNGSIDEVRISNIARTPEEIRQAYQAGISIRGGQAQLAYNEILPEGNTSALWHFNEGEGNILSDLSGNGNDGVVHGANWTDGVMGSALEFDGVNDYVEFPASDRVLQEPK